MWAACNKRILQNGNGASPRDGAETLPEDWDIRWNPGLVYDMLPMHLHSSTEVCVGVNETILWYAYLSIPYLISSCRPAADDPRQETWSLIRCGSSPTFIRRSSDVCFLPCF